MQTPAKPVLKMLRGLFIWFSTLCTTDEKRLEIAVLRCVSGNSDPEGRWFESSRAHQNHQSRQTGLVVFLLLFYPLQPRTPHLLCGPKTSVPIFETSKGSPAALAAGAPFYFAFYTIIARPLAALWCASFLQSHLFAPLQNSHPKTPLDTARFSLSQLN